MPACMCDHGSIAGGRLLGKSIFGQKRLGNLDLIQLQATTFRFGIEIFFSPASSHVRCILCSSVKLVGTAAEFGFGLWVLERICMAFF